MLTNQRTAQRLIDVLTGRDVRREDECIRTTSTNCTGLEKLEFWLTFLMGIDASWTPAHSTITFGLVTVSI